MTRTEADIIEKLDSVPNKAGYIKELIRRDIENNKNWENHYGGIAIMGKKNWYALLWDSDDTDWGTGTFDWDEAVKRAKSAGYERIAEIDGGYDADGNATADPICVAEYISGEDF